MGFILFQISSYPIESDLELSDGPPRLNKKGTPQQASPLNYSSLDGTIPGLPQSNVSLDASLPRTNRAQSKIPLKNSINGGVEQHDHSLGSIPGPESCV